MSESYEERTVTLSPPEPVAVDSGAGGPEPSFRWIAKRLPGILYHCVHDPAGAIRYRYFSPRVEEVTGFAPDCFYEDPEMIFSRFHADDLRDYRDKMRCALGARVERDWGFEFRFRHRDGHYIWLASHATRTYAEDGSVDTWGVFLDITSRKTSEQDHRMSELQLRESQRKLATLISNLAGMVYRRGADRKRTMQFVSKGCEQLTGYAPGDLQFNRKVAYHDLIHPEDRERVNGELDTALTQWRPYVISYRIITESGGEKRVLDQGQGIAASDGSLTALEGFAQELSTRDSAESNSLAVEDPATDALSRRQGAAVAEFREISGLESGAIRLSRLAFDCRAPVVAVANLQSAAVQAKGVALKLEFLDDLSRERALGDSRRIEQLVGRLVDGAVERSLGGRVVLRVACAPGAAGSITLCYEVADSASHSAAGDLECVFAGGPAGSGRDGARAKDLLYCRRLAAVLGGELSARPDPGAGACVRFTITLPLERASL